MRVATAQVGKALSLGTGPIATESIREASGAKANWAAAAACPRWIVTNLQRGTTVMHAKLQTFLDMQVMRNVPAV